jgi:aryl-alcohol dehydrogenase-like predicted oxidoreductase
LGTARIAGLGWHRDGDLAPTGGPQAEAEAIRVVHRAIDLGIAFIDTADVYGAGAAERVLGRALAGHRHKVVIATKFGETFDEFTRRAGLPFEPGGVYAACEASLRRLGTDVIDLYLFHLRDYDLARAVQVREALEDLVRQGKIRAYGWSTDDVERARLFAQGPHCAAIEHRLNVLMDAPEMIALCEEQRLAGVARIPLAMGMLSGRWNPNTALPETDRRSDFWHVPQFLEDMAQVSRLREVLTRDGRTYVQGALGWIWARSPWAVPVPGFTRMAQVEENATALRLGPLAPAQMATIERLLKRDAGGAARR